MSNYAIVLPNVADLWSAPKYNSERVNQALFGEQVLLMEVNEDFSHVQLPDGYAGWIDSRYISQIDDIGKGPNFVVKASSVMVKAQSGTPIWPFRLFYGTRIRARADKRGRLSLLNTGPVPRYISQRSAADITKSPSISPNIRKLLIEARQFLGVPYLWGGRTPMGFDCSGFVQLIFGRFGINLPRDTKDQVEHGTRITREEIKAGDLLFFKRHVAIAINNRSFIHSSIGGSGVNINSFEPSADNYRKDLDIDFKLARRVI